MTAALEILANQSYSMMKKNKPKFRTLEENANSENFKRHKTEKRYDDHSEKKEESMDSVHLHRLLMKKRRRALSSDIMKKQKVSEDFTNKSLILLHESIQDQTSFSDESGYSKSDSDQSTDDTDQTPEAEMDQQGDRDQTVSSDQTAEADTDQSVEEEKTKGTEGPYRRLSMLAAASLLETANNKQEEKEKVSRRTSDFSETLEMMETINDNMMARRHPLMYGDFENAILARQVSLIAAQAASYETHYAKRRASLIAAAGVFESLKKERSRCNSYLGTTSLSLSRRNSLLAVSNLLSNIENSNDPLKLALRRRGSDMSLGSFDSTPSRSSSLDHLHNNMNILQRHQESLNIQMMSSDKEKKSNVVSMDSFKSLYVSMEKSKASQIAIHDWDRKMGLRRSHSQTMRNSSRSRKKLITVMVVGKGETK